MTNIYTLGIDLGTTYTCAAVYRNGRAEVIESYQGNRKIPSCIAFTDNGRIVGEGTSFQSSFNYENTVTDIKRMMGRKFLDAKILRSRAHWPFKVVNVNNKPVVEVSLYKNQVRFSPEELSAMILSKIKSRADEILPVPVEEAVITVPAHFNNAQRQATKDAGRIAGINVLRLLSEPTAAALASGLIPSDNLERNILVFDLGGGTLDVSLLNVKENQFIVVATSGNSELGGEDFTTKLVEHCINDFRKKYKHDLTFNTRAMSRLREACERSKINLATSQSETVIVDSIHMNIDFSLEIGRNTFNELCRELFTMCIQCISNLLKEKNMKPKDIAEVVMTGGSSRIIEIQAFISRFFGKRILNTSFSMDEAVACGASIQAYQMKEGAQKGQRQLISDVNPFSLGIEVVDYLMEIIIQKNTIIPFVATKEFTTVDDYQKSVVCAIYEGEDKNINRNLLLGSFELENIERARKGVPVLKVTFNLDSSGILLVTERDMKTDSVNQIRINGQGNLSKEEILNMTKVNKLFGLLDIVQGRGPRSELTKKEKEKNIALIIKMRAVF